MQEMRVQFLVWDDPLEKGRAIHSGILAWKILRTEECGGPQSMGVSKESDTTEQLTHTSLSRIKQKLPIGVQRVTHSLSLLIVTKNTPSFTQVSKQEK